MDPMSPQTQSEQHFTIILEGIRSDFRAVSNEVFEIRKEVHATRQEMRESIHRVEGELVKVHQRMDRMEVKIDHLETRFDDQHRQINGIMEMVAQNTEDIYAIKETRLDHSPNKPRLA